MRRLSTIAHLPHTGIAILGAALAFGVAAPAQAAGKKKEAASKEASGDKKKQAREAYQGGEAAYKAGDYKTAYEGFKKANDLIPSIVAEYWMAMAQSYLDDAAAGISSLEAVLMSSEAEKLGEEKLNAADARMKALKNAPASVSVTSDPPGAQITVDYKDQPEVTPTTISVPPGTHKISLSLKGYEPFAAEITVKAAQKLEQTAKLEKAKEEPPKVAAAPPPAAKPKEEAPAAPAPAPAAEEKKDNLPAYIALGAAVVGAGIGTFFGVKALSAKSDYDSHPTNDGADKVERNALISDMSFGIALALGITGGVLLLTGGGDSSGEMTAKSRVLPRPQRARLDIAPMITPHAQGAAARFVF